MTDRYWESTRPGAGRRAPRAYAVSDATVLSLNGTWRFRLSPTAAGTGDDFVRADFDDATWDPMRVPSHWVLEEFTPLAGGERRSMLGTAEGPLYTNTAYPIPLDPPHVSEANPTGDYRLVFDVPADFGDAVLRFQGVDSCAKVWLNGEELGWSMGSRLPFELDAPVRPGRNVLAVRVQRWSAGTYLEDQDMWWMPGIFRDVELLARPQEAIDDHFVHADFDHLTGLGTLRVDATAPALVDIPELGISVQAGETVVVPVEPWSAETPRLYRGTLRSGGEAGETGEAVELAIGFRTVAIVDGVFTVNGRPVTFRGVNRHEHDPHRGRTLDSDSMREDLLLMKRANIDAVRTSHYPPHPEFLRHCDELGMWVVLENDLETHGFIYEGWKHNPPALPEWQDTIMDRLQRTVERDKNHPSIVVWSLANESMTGDAFDEMRRWLDTRDPSRPVLYERDPSFKDSDFYSLMYPSLELLEQIGRREEPRSGTLSMHGMVFGDSDSNADADEAVDPVDERRRGLPFLLVEYAHAMGNGPGSLSDYWRIMRDYDRICGGFVWEWIDHGFAATTADGIGYIMHGQDVDYEPNGGRFSLHGLVFSDRTPTPALAQLAKAYAQLRLEVTGDAVTIRNDRHSADSSDLEFVWTLQVGAETAGEGVLDVAPIDAGASAVVLLPATAVESDDARVLTVQARLRAATAWAPAGHVVAWDAAALSSASMSSPVAPGDEGEPVDGGEIRLGDTVLDATTGRLLSLAGMEIDGPWLDLHRAPTENDHGQGENNNIAKVWQQTGMNRMEHRTDSVRSGDGWLKVTGRTAPRTHPHGVAWTMLWQQDGDGVELTATADFVGPWADTPYMHRDIWVPRLGLLFALPGAYADVGWQGRGPSETYVDSWEGSPLGRYAETIDALQVPYPVPQENGNHIDTSALTVRGDGVPELRVEGRDVFDFTARRWTSHDLERATHPHELVDSGRVWLNIDHRQLGLGSASVGPATPERYRIPRERTTWRVRLSAG